jgi:hypothetical protein
MPIKAALVLLIADSACPAACVVALSCCAPALDPPPAPAPRKLSSRLLSSSMPRRASELSHKIVIA